MTTPENGRRPQPGELEAPGSGPESAAHSTAREFAKMGAKVFPLKPGSKAPATAHGFKDATTDLAQVDAWAAQYPGCNWGMANGSRFDVIDLDGPEGVASALEHFGGTLPEALGTVATPHGLHLYLPRTGKPRRVKALPKVDLMGAGGYVVLPGSVLADGKAYTWAGTPDLGGQVDLGPWLTLWADKAPAVTPSGQLPAAASDYVRAMLDGIRADVAEAATKPDGWMDAQGRGWQKITADAAYRLGRATVTPGSGLDMATAEALFLDALAPLEGDTLDLGAEWKRQAHRGAQAGPLEALPTGPEAFGLTPPPAQVPAAPGQAPAAQVPGRHVAVRAASSFSIRPVRWLWDGRIARGTLSLVAGREGTGKSTLCYWLAAQVTRGGLPGDFQGQPGAVLVCATEDSWEHTIVPRLMAAGADLDRVYAVEAVTADGVHLGLSLPHDTTEVERIAKEVGARLMLMDPLMSRLESGLDSHKDADTRRALEPITALAEAADMAVVGLMHHNKSGSSDPLALVMGSKAFTAVARSVHTVIEDPTEGMEDRRLFATVKNNLGRMDLPTLAYTIHTAQVQGDGCTVATSRLQWAGEVRGRLQEYMAPDDDRSATDEAADWLRDYLQSQGGQQEASRVLVDAKAAGIAEATLKRARKRAGIKSNPVPGAFPRRTQWELPAPVGSPSPGESSDDLTTTTGSHRPLSAPVGSVGSTGSHRGPVSRLGLTQQQAEVLAAIGVVQP